MGKPSLNQIITSDINFDSAYFEKRALGIIYLLFQVFGTWR